MSSVGHPLIVLWATPRSTSTAFEWMMRMRGDITCFHEPFGEAWHYGENPLWPRRTEEMPKKSGLTYESVLDRLLTSAKERPVFSKDMAHFTAHLWNEDFLSCFKHTFLIRHPHKSISSIYRDGPEFGLSEIGMKEQQQLFDLVRESCGEVPVVIDSDDLLEAPYQMVEAYCRLVGIPFIAKALSWQPGSRDEVSWYDGGSWHESLKNSDGLKPQPKKTIDIAKAPRRVQELCEIVMPHYEYLYKHRFVVC